MEVTEGPLTHYLFAPPRSLRTLPPSEHLMILAAHAPYHTNSASDLHAAARPAVVASAKNRWLSTLEVRSGSCVTSTVTSMAVRNCMRAEGGSIGFGDQSRS